MRRAGLVLGLVVFALVLGWDLARASSPIELRILKRGTVYQVELSQSVPVPPELAWEVLTDFDAMARFVPNLEVSRITRREGARLWIMQSGIARFGPIAQRFESEREIELGPGGRIRARQVRGTLLSFESLATISAKPGGCQIVYRVEFEPALDLPAWVGAPVVRHEIEEQFAAIAREMIRRRPAQPRANPQTPPLRGFSPAGPGGERR